MSCLYIVSGTTSATAATDQHAVAEIWNPSSTRTVSVVEISCFATSAPGAGAGLLVRRSTARGTAGATVTPAAVNHAKGKAAPDSGFLLDLGAFSGQPTLTSGDLWGFVFAAAAASGIIYPCPRGIEVPPGEGLCIVNRTNIAVPVSEVSFLVEEI